MARAYFGDKLKTARKAKNLTQKELANLLGVKHNSISNWENNQNKPDPDTIELICGVLNVTPNYLLASESDDTNPQEKLLLKQYRKLDSHGKKIVDMVLQEEYNRVSSSQMNLRLVGKNGKKKFTLSRKKVVEALKKDSEKDEPLPPGFI